MKLKSDLAIHLIINSFAKYSGKKPVIETKKKKMHFTKKDFLSSIVTGLTTGIIIWQIANHLGTKPFFGISFVWLILAVPVIWIIGVNFGYLLGKFIGIFSQFGKFTAVGFTNSAVDFGVLTVLLGLFGVTAGFLYTVAKSISFIVANIHSFVWNKFWVFNAGDSGKTEQQFGKFFMVSLVCLVINVTTASIIVNKINRSFGFSPDAWALLGAIVASAVALIFSFIGIRLAVFNKKDESDTISQIPTENLQ